MGPRFKKTSFGAQSILNENIKFFLVTAKVRDRNHFLPKDYTLLFFLYL